MHVGRGTRTPQWQRCCQATLPGARNTLCRFPVPAATDATAAATSTATAFPLWQLRRRRSCRRQLHRCHHDGTCCRTRMQGCQARQVPGLLQRPTAACSIAAGGRLAREARPLAAAALQHTRCRRRPRRRSGAGGRQAWRAWSRRPVPPCPSCHALGLGPAVARPQTQPKKGARGVAVNTMRGVAVNTTRGVARPISLHDTPVSQLCPAAWPCSRVAGECSLGTVPRGSPSNPTSQRRSTHFCAAASRRARDDEHAKACRRSLPAAPRPPPCRGRRSCNSSRVSTLCVCAAASRSLEPGRHLPRLVIRELGAPPACAVQDVVHRRLLICRVLRRW